MDSAKGDASIEHKETHDGAAIEADDDHDLPILNKLENGDETSCSSSTSSDDSSDEDFFQLDASELSKSVAGRRDIPGAQHGDNPQLASEFRIQNGGGTSISHSSNNGAVNSEVEGVIAGSQVPTGKPLSPDLSKLGTRQSPPVQMMGKSDVPDPNRIPSSVFARSKSTAPMEWSVASNESLFSIHVGNSSFSKDHVILMGRSGDLTNFSNGPLDGHTPPIAPLAGSDQVRSDVVQGVVQPGAAAAAAAAANAEAMKDVVRAAAEEHADKDQPLAEGVPKSASLSRHSDGSTTSFSSFAFPILTGEGRSGSTKIEPEPQPLPQQPQQHPMQKKTSKSVLAASECKWFPYFTCCSSCC